MSPQDSSFTTAGGDSQQPEADDFKNCAGNEPAEDSPAEQVVGSNSQTAPASRTTSELFKHLATNFKDNLKELNPQKAKQAGERAKDKAKEFKQLGLEKASDLKNLSQEALEALKAKSDKKTTNKTDQSKTSSQRVEVSDPASADSAKQLSGYFSGEAAMKPADSPMAEHGRYTSSTNAITRRAAQMLLLKPAVWSALKVEVHGKNHLSHLSGPFIAIANHSSHFDAPLIFGSLPKKQAKYLATGAAADYFFNHWWKSLPVSLFFNAFPVNRGGSKGRKGIAGKLLSDGVPLLLFPEGTRSRTGAMGPFKPGAAALCISRNVPCVPIALVGAFEAWPYDEKRWRPGRPEVHVVIGEPMYPQPGEIAHQFSERMRRKVMELHDSTARAYRMKTLADYGLPIAIERAKVGDTTALNQKSRLDRLKEARSRRQK